MNLSKYILKESTGAGYSFSAFFLKEKEVDWLEG